MRRSSALPKHHHSFRTRSVVWKASES